jgi:HSP20 family molecular chaperone IbpA
MQSPDEQNPEFEASRPVEVGAGETGAVPPESERPRQQRFVFTPPIDIFETDEGLVLHADLPGVTVETLELQVQNNKLTLFGRVKPQVPAGARPVHIEYEVGDFLRSFILSDDVDHDRIRAKLNGGVLEIVLPKAPEAETRFIQVNSD